MAVKLSAEEFDNTEMSSRLPNVPSTTTPASLGPTVWEDGFGVVVPTKPLPTTAA